MLQEVFQDLDQWIGETNRERNASNVGEIVHFTITVLGQVGLMEAKLDLDLAATTDVDALVTGEHCVKTKFNELLEKRGKHLDFLAHEIWMPPETVYQDFFRGTYFTAKIAKAEFILVSKALKAPEKNKPLLIEYLAKGASDLFFLLAKKHQVNLERFIR